MNYDVSHLPELTDQPWLAVPDEGWTPAAATAGNPHVCMLNGTWDLALAPRDKARGWRDLDGRWWRWDDAGQALRPHDKDQARGLDATFMKADPGDAAWRSIPVPGNWEQHGFANHVFAHMSLDRDDVVGYYRRRVDLPDGWLGEGRVILQAEGVAASAEVWINEQFAGYHDGGFVPFQLDVTDLIRAGENLVAIRVVKADISTVHDSAGQWMLSGIWRDIFLFHVGDAHVRDFHVEPDFDPATRAGRLHVEVEASVAEGAIEAVLLPWEADDAPIASTRMALDGGAATLDLAAADIEPWTPETPHMYRLECRLIVGGRVVERVREEVGFRRFHADGERFLLNGEPFLIRGVTRHEIKQGRGRSLSIADYEHEIRLMRQANVTGVRSHPYPFDPRFIKLCARHGIVVCSGYCLCGYNSWGNPWTMSETKTYPAHESTFDAGYRRLFQQRYWSFAPKIYARLRNCTAIFAWSLSNESAISEIFYPVARFLREREQRRFIISAGESNMIGSKFYQVAPQQQPLVEHIRRDLLTADAEHYPERQAVDELRRRIPLIDDRPRPVFYTEAAHVFCNRDHFLLDPGILGDTWGRGLKGFFEAVKNLTGVGGYFIFEWSGQSVMQKGDPAQDVGFIRPWHGYKTYVQNIKGIIGPNHELKPSYHSLRKTYAPIRFGHERAADGTLRLELHNGHRFLDLSALRFRVIQAAADGSRAVSPLAVEAAPNRTATVDLPAPSDGVRRIVVEAHHPNWPEPIAEHEIIVGERPWPGADAEPQSTRPVVRNGRLRGLAGEAALDFIAPVEPVWGLTDPRQGQRDIGMGHMTVGELPGGVIGPDDIQSVQTREQSDAHRVTRHRLRDDLGSIDCELRWRVDGEAVVIEQTIRRRGDAVWFTGAGLSLRLTADYDHLCWRRRTGVWTEYPDDHPDRLAGAAPLDRDEYPLINHFRWPAWSAFPHVRDADRVLLAGLRQPPVLFIAQADRQRLAVRTRPDGARDVLLLFEQSCNLPWHEFSFFRGPSIREQLMDIHPLGEDQPWRQSWRMTLCRR